MKHHPSPSRTQRALWCCTSRQKHLLVPRHQDGKLQTYQVCISIIFLPVSSWWCTFLRHKETRNLFQIHKEALKSIADWLTSSSSLQNLIKTRPRDCTWSTKLLDFKYKVLKDFWKTNFYQIFTEGTFGKNSKCSIFLFVFILAFYFYRY